MGNASDGNAANGNHTPAGNAASAKNTPAGNAAIGNATNGTATEVESRAKGQGPQHFSENAVVPAADMLWQMLKGGP